MDFLRKLYRDSQIESEYYPIDRDFLKNHLDTLLLFDRADIVLGVCNCFPESYAMQFLCCFPEVWEDLERHDINRMVSNLNDVGRIPFLEFTYKILELNLFSEFKAISLSHDRLFNYFAERWHDLTLNEEEIEDFEDGSLARLEAFKIVGLKLQYGLGIARANNHTRSSIIDDLKCKQP